MAKGIYRLELKAGIHDTRLKARAAVTRANRAIAKAWYTEQLGGHLTTVQKARLAIVQASRTIRGDEHE